MTCAQMACGDHYLSVKSFYCSARSTRFSRYGVSVKAQLQGMAHSLTELLFPSRCVHCGTDGELLCQACIESGARITAPSCRRCASPTLGAGLCPRCAARPAALNRLIAVFQLDGAIREAIHRLKYDDIRALAPRLGALLADAATGAGLQADVIVPVPLHGKRIRQRGYNQAELLAGPVAKALGAALDKRLLSRRLNTPSQALSSSEEARRENVAAAFQASDAAAGRRIVLIDDVTTTGSTLQACAASLKDRGATYVAAAVLAKEI